MLFQRANESELTYRLKWAAWEWLYSAVGCRGIGFEVGLEGPGGRVADVAGLGPERTLYIVEVKASRSDLRRDDHDAMDRARLQQREPALRRMAELAGEIAGQEPDGSQAALDAALLQRRLALHPQRVSAFSTKFRDPRYVRIADYNYLMAPCGLLRRSELPPLWGLLDPTPRLRVEAVRTGGHRTVGAAANILRAIARANTREMMRAHGARWKEGGVLFPHTPGAEVSPATRAPEV